MRNSSPMIQRCSGLRAGHDFLMLAKRRFGQAARRRRRARAARRRAVRRRAVPARGPGAPWSRRGRRGRGPPKAQEVGCVTGSATSRSSRPSGREPREAAAAPARVPQETLGIDRGAVRRAGRDVGGGEGRPRERAVGRTAARSIVPARVSAEIEASRPAAKAMAFGTRTPSAAEPSGAPPGSRLQRPPESSAPKSRIAPNTGPAGRVRLGVVETDRRAGGRAGGDADECPVAGSKP